MLKFLVYKMLILHSSPVLLPRKVQVSQNWLVGDPHRGSRAFYFSTCILIMKKTVDCTLQ